ncbi:MAG: hypothetical protein KDJ34_10785 [Candidatus Competibacteraceae bacterium]|nr:hypothetical protein [Candidatus Competibacteraceae bacterium]
MDTAQVLNALAQASLFELYRLSAAIDQQLRDPQRLQAIKNALRVGQTVEYFVAAENCTISARIEKLQRTHVDVIHLSDGTPWRIPYYMLNVHGVETRLPHTPAQGLSRQALSVGDWVGFVDQHGVEWAGAVQNLNPKTASIQCQNGRWRVAYERLFRVLNPDAAHAPLIDHPVD